VIFLRKYITPPDQEVRSFKTKTNPKEIRLMAQKGDTQEVDSKEITKAGSWNIPLLDECLYGIPDIAKHRVTNVDLVNSHSF